jgi:hypothetical protein
MDAGAQAFTRDRRRQGRRGVEREAAERSAEVRCFLGFSW